MRLFEFISSKEDVLYTVRDILTRARSQGADNVSIEQLANEFGGDISKEELASMLSKNRQLMKGLVDAVTLDTVEFTKNKQEKMQATSDKKLKTTALKQARKGIDI
jgi:aminoglycoside phosphotransferase family enzyme